jgi:hypothetical protein
MNQELTKIIYVIPERLSDDGVAHALYFDRSDHLRCLSSKALAAIPEDFKDCLQTLSDDIQLALDCLRIFGGVPIPVAKAILRNADLTYTAIDMAVRTTSAIEGTAK